MVRERLVLGLECQWRIVMHWSWLQVCSTLGGEFLSRDTLSLLAVTPVWEGAK